MKCSKCNYFKKIGNTNETGRGLCSFPETIIPTNKNRECMLDIDERPLVCGDCDRFKKDDACLWCSRNDPVYRISKDGSQYICSGFIDKREEDIKNALIFWRINGVDIEKKLKKINIEVDKVIKKINNRFDFDFGGM